MNTLLSVILLRLGSVEAVTTKCVKEHTGVLATNQFANASGDLVFRAYYFNSRGEVSYDPSSTKHPFINIEYQTCTPNYAQEPNGEFDTDRYGRFYIPSANKCLAVTNPSGSPPYYVSSQACPALVQMTTKTSIPFNFVSDESGGEFDMRWSGGTIPSKSIYQGPNPPAQYCFGQYFVNATNLQQGHHFNGLGEPVTSGSSAEMRRVHLYCQNKKDGKGSTSFNSFTVLDPAFVS